MGRELIFAPAGFFARGAAPHAARAPPPAPISGFLTRFSPRIPAQSLLFRSAEVSMRGDTRLWPSLIALTFVAVSGLSVSDGRSHASSPIVDGHRPVSRDRAKAESGRGRHLDDSAARDTKSAGHRTVRAGLRLAATGGFRARHDMGSGFLISRDGEILTSDHVVADADVIRVRLLGMETATYRATVVGRDPISDSALIRLQEPPGDLPFATLGDSDALQTGDWVMAIGNPLRARSHRDRRRRRPSGTGVRGR